MTGLHQHEDMMRKGASEDALAAYIGLILGPWPMAATTKTADSPALQRGRNNCLRAVANAPNAISKAVRGLTLHILTRHRLRWQPLRADSGCRTIMDHGK